MAVDGADDEKDKSPSKSKLGYAQLGEGEGRSWFWCHFDLVWCTSGKVNMQVSVLQENKRPRSWFCA